MQDLEGGGIGDRPGDWVDVFHTIFGVAGESSLLLTPCIPSLRLHLDPFPDLDLFLAVAIHQRRQSAVSYRLIIRSIPSRIPRIRRYRSGLLYARCLDQGSGNK